MESRDGLYLNGAWVSDAGGVATTHQGNDLTKPDSLQVSHTNTFSLSDTLAIRELTGNAEQLDSGSTDPYTLLPARIEVAGETLFTGYGEMTDFSEGWEVTLYEAMLNLFDRLDRSIRTADLSAFDHPWTLEIINQYASADKGVCYPLINYGLLSGGEIPLDVMFPAFFVHTLIGQMLHEEGYTMGGDLPTDALYKRLVIPFTEETPTNYDQDWQDKRTASVGMQLPDQAVSHSVYETGRVVDRVEPYTIDNVPEQGFSQGTLHNFNTTTHCFVCDVAMRVKVTALKTVKGSNIAGSLEFILMVEKNGQNVGQTELSTGSNYNLLNIKTETLQLDELVACQAGDQLRIRFIAHRQTALGAYTMTVYNDSDRSRATFTPDLTARMGDTWSVARNLPSDITGKKLMVAMAYLNGGTWYVDPLRRQIRFGSLSRTVADTAGAVDWSDRIDTATKPKWTPRIDPYAQNNLMKWKQIDDTQRAGITTTGLYGEKTTVGYGDGNITVNATTLDTETTLFEMPFAASVNSDDQLSSYGPPVLIKTRTVSRSGGNVTINNQATSPRLLLVDPATYFPVPSKRFSDDGLTATPVTVNLMACWFNARPPAVGGIDTAFSLMFGKPAQARGEVCLIDRHYTGLLRLLDRMRVLDISMRLRPEDISSLDLGKPVRLQRVRVGGLTLSSHYFVVNKIAGYQPGKTCVVTLIGY